MIVSSNCYNRGKTGALPRLLLLICCCFGSHVAFAAWQPDEAVLIPSNVPTTITLNQAGESNRPASTTLWFFNKGDSEIHLPETVASAKGQAAIPVFARGEGSGEIQVYDSATATTNSVPWKTKTGNASEQTWIPHLELLTDDDLPLVYANQKVTATLDLKQGTGIMPPSAHIKITDHRGQLVAANHYNTFDLVAGQETIVIPSAGFYTVTLQLIDDPITSLPRALMREPQPIPFGKTINDIEIPERLPDGVTTNSLVGSRIALENIPTTATLGAQDRLTITVFGKHSKEIQRNRWPFGIAGADLLNMTIVEQKARGAELLRWQRRLGSSFAPVLLEWETVQKSPQRFSWSLLNSAMSIHRKIQVRPVVTLTGRAAWNDQLPTETSATLDAWTGFTRRLSEQHLKKIWGLQIWEHPTETWSDPADYAKIIDATLTGFQTRNGQLIAAPPVIVGGTSGVDTEYLDAALTSDTANRLSLSFEFNPEKSDIGPKEAGFLDAIEKAANLLTKNNAAGRQISVSTGYSHSPAGVTGKMQANYLVRSYVLAMSQGVYKVMWNSLMDKSEIPWAANSRDRMGLLDVNLVPKLSGVAYNVMSYLMSGATPVKVTQQDKAMIYEFNIPVQNNKWPGTLYVAWTESPDQVQDVRLEMTHGGGVYALDYLGAEVHARKVAEDSANSIVGSYQIPVGFEPVFIWDAGKPGQKD